MTDLGQLMCYTKMKIIQIFTLNQLRPQTDR